jgi:hypothetical protein
MELAYVDQKTPFGTGTNVISATSLFFPNVTKHN